MSLPVARRHAHRLQTASPGARARPCTGRPRSSTSSRERSPCCPSSRSIDDQIEWLDDDTILYGMPHEGVAGDTDVWMLEADGSGEPEVFIEHAWSPSVVRG